MFYVLLRGYGLRAHVAKNVYKQALALVKASRENGGSRPRVKRLSARLDYCDAKVDLKSAVVEIALRGKLFVSTVFEFDYRPYAPRGLMALDVNLRKVATFDGCDTRRYETEFLKALSKRARAKGLQKKYPKRWRYSTTATTM